jgi:hypothetical protein
MSDASLSHLESIQIAALQSYLNPTEKNPSLPQKHLTTESTFYTSPSPYLPTSQTSSTTILPLYGSSNITVNLKDVQLSSLRREVIILKESLDCYMKNNRSLELSNIELTNESNAKAKKLELAEVNKRNVEKELSSLSDEFTRFKLKAIEDDTKLKQKIRDDRRKDKNMIKQKDSEIYSLKVRVDEMDGAIESERRDRKRLESVVANMRRTLEDDLEAKKSRLVVGMREKMQEHAIETKRKYDETVERLKREWVKREEVEERVERVRKEYEGVIELYRKKGGGGGGGVEGEG